MDNRLSLFDLVSITVGKESFFGIVVLVKQTGIEEDGIRQRLKNIRARSIRIHLNTKVYILVSEPCRALLRNERKVNENRVLFVSEATSITSTTRLISAVHRLEDEEKSMVFRLLAPNIEDPYFQLPKDGPSLSSTLRDFNETQMEIIHAAMRIFESEMACIRMIIGPPGETYLDPEDIFTCVCFSFSLTRHGKEPHYRRHRSTITNGFILWREVADMRSIERDLRRIDESNHCVICHSRAGVRRR